MWLDEYFKNHEYYLDKGRGVTIFQSNDTHYDEIIDYFEDRDQSYYDLKSSDIKSHARDYYIDGLDFDFFIFYQDLDFSDFKKIGEKVANHLVYPAFYLNKPIIFISEIGKSSYTDLQIKSGLLHTEIEEIRSLLYVEQIYNLLAQVNVDLDSEEDALEDDNIYTPIEIIIKNHLEENRIEYQSQVKLGRHYVDFLVQDGARKLIVECDGRDYHNPHSDSERDKELGKFNIKILRLSGSEIFHSPQECINKIQQELLTTVPLHEKNIDNDLDDSQKLPLKHITGPCRVLAPAGSGKTKTLVNRIVHLTNVGIDENKILALAFNKKAADEMSDRLGNKGIEVSNRFTNSGVSIRTFHSFGLEIIRDYLKWSFNGERETLDTRNFIKKAYEPFIQVPGYRTNDTIDKMLEALRRAKMELIPVEEITVELEDEIVPFDKIFYKYQEIQKDHNFFNFDDMIYLSLRILIDNPIARNIFQNRFQYILVDEFQDLNEAQLLLMEVLSLPNNNLFIVGDDDQMIYGWRGAKITHILNFPNRYSISEDFTLKTNYRCTKKIVKHSSWLIKNNINRVPKDIKPKIDADTGEFSIELGDNLYEQAVAAVDWIRDKKETENLNWKDFAVLYRLHEYQYPVAMLLDSYNIPHTPINNTRLFAKNPGKDLYAYLTVILHPNDATKDDFERILKKPNKYFSNDLIAHATNWETFQTLDRVPQEQWRKDKVRSFIDQIEDIQSQYETTDDAPEELVISIYDTFNFKDYYKDQSIVLNDIEKASDDIIIDVIISVSRLFNTIDDFYSAIYNAINEPYLQANNQDTNSNEIQLTTIHTAKGKEFKNVIYFNLIQSEIDQSETQLEEERRVCYVGVTRAIKNILITSSKERTSIFLKELVKNPEFNGTSDVQLNNLYTQVKQDERLLKGKITHLNSEIEQIYNTYPELRGEELQINVELQTLVQINNISILERKFPELQGKPMKTNFLLLKNYFITQRLKNIEKAKNKIIELNKEIEEITSSEIDKRRSDINTNAKLIDDLSEKITNISNTELVICQDKLSDIDSEKYFRNIFNN